MAEHTLSVGDGGSGPTLSAVGGCYERFTAQPTARLVRQPCLNWAELEPTG